MSNIPKQKHSNDELSDLRARSAMQVANSPIEEIYSKKLAHRAIVVLGYALPLIAPLWAIVNTMRRVSGYTMGDFYIMTIPVILGLIIALWIALKCVLSRHNSAFILIISLFCCFPIVSAVNSDKYLKYELMSLIGLAQPDNDPLLDSETDSGSSDGNSDSVREQLKKERDRIRGENSKSFRSREAPPVTPER
jgi:hypothetical protein